MEDAEAALQHQLPAALRQLQPTALQAIHQVHSHAHAHHHGHPLAPSIPPDLDGLDPNADAFPSRLHVELGDGADSQHLQAPSSFEPGQHHAFHDARMAAPPQTPHGSVPGGQFGLLTPGPSLTGPGHEQHGSLDGLPPEPDLFPPPEGSDPVDGQLEDLKNIPDPPNLQAWRQRLFDIDQTITLSEDEFQTYFPHVDNVYSHRSTQRYKRKPFISHYWDCRLKGRPPGTPKSDDPNKKKRKRIARPRDLCDVKIKITEYFPIPMATEDLSSLDASAPLDTSSPNDLFDPTQPGGPPLQESHQAFGILTSTGGYPPGHPALSGEKYYTIQRVNGNGGNGKGDGVPGPHKHTLEDSDRVKKNSVQRYVLKDERDRRKTHPKTYHKRATGLALATVKQRSKESDLKLYGSCFCPFVQRIWIALEVKGLPYQYIEVDPYKKPDSLLQVNPRGLVPALQHGNWGCYESTVLLEYLEDLHTGHPILPIGDPQTRAHCRLWADQINRHIIPLFYRCLQAQEIEKQVEHAEDLKTEISRLVDVADMQGPFFLGPDISWVDIQFAPWMLRLPRVLRPYRGWPDPEAGSRWGVWMDAVENHEAVKATTSTDELYYDSYERYAENRPNTSQLARAINAGRGLP